MLFFSHKITVVRLRKMRAKDRSGGPANSGRCLLTRARSMARWVMPNQDTDGLSRWFPDRFCGIYSA